MQYKYMLPICYIFTADNSTILMMVMMYVTMAKWEETNKLIFRYHIQMSYLFMCPPHQRYHSQKLLALGNSQSIYFRFA